MMKQSNGYPDSPDCDQLSHRQTLASLLQGDAAFSVIGEWEAYFFQSTSAVGEAILETASNH